MQFQVRFIGRWQQPTWECLQGHIASCLVAVLAKGWTSWTSNTRASACGSTPGSERGPSMVWVLPAPEIPYAIITPLCSLPLSNAATYGMRK